jgi:metal-responsive CopG/Arc/MetJ family transcriptional regulator
MRERKEKISISIDPMILKRIDEKRIKDGRSRSNFIEHVLIMRLGEKYTVKRRYIS